jgi:hypothetical protein
MYALLACAVALCPAVQRGLDEGVAGQLREKYQDKLSRMARGDEVRCGACLEVAAGPLGAC